MNDMSAARRNRAGFSRTPSGRLPDLPDIIRTSKHLGELVMSIPAILAAPEADIVVSRPFAALLDLLPITGKVIPFDRGNRKAFLPAVFAIRGARDRRYKYGVLLAETFSSAAMFKLAGVRHIRGVVSDQRGRLLDEPIDYGIMHGNHRYSAYYEILTRSRPATPMVPVIHVDAERRAAWWERARLPKQRFVGVFPSSSASARRWEPSRFAEVVDVLSRDIPVVVFGGPGEAELTRFVAGEHGIDMGGKTELSMLAAALAECDVLISNDSGPPHVGAAVGTQTLSLWGAGDPTETGVVGAAHAMLRHPELPCVPCVKNVCPRNGKGYILPEASRECLQLIAVPDVLSAAQTMLAQ